MLVSLEQPLHHMRRTRSGHLLRLEVCAALFPALLVFSDEELVKLVVFLVDMAVHVLLLLRGEIGSGRTHELVRGYLLKEIRMI